MWSLFCLHDVQLPLIFGSFCGSSARGGVMTNYQELSRNTLNTYTIMNTVSWNGAKTRTGVVSSRWQGTNQIRAVEMYCCSPKCSSFHNQLKDVNAKKSRCKEGAVPMTCCCGKVSLGCRYLNCVQQQMAVMPWDVLGLAWPRQTESLLSRAHLLVERQWAA